MTQSMNPQIITALADATRLNEGEGLLLALHPNFILVVRSGMNEDERESAAAALLSAAEGLSLPVLKDPMDDVDNGASKEDGLYIAPGMLDTAGIFDLGTLQVFNIFTSVRSYDILSAEKLCFYLIMGVMEDAFCCDGQVGD